MINAGPAIIVQLAPIHLTKSFAQQAPIALLVLTNQPPALQVLIVCPWVLPLQLIATSALKVPIARLRASQPCRPTIAMQATTAQLPLRAQHQSHVIRVTNALPISVPKSNALSDITKTSPVKLPAKIAPPAPTAMQLT